MIWFIYNSKKQTTFIIKRKTPFQKLIKTTKIETKRLLKREWEENLQPHGLQVQEKNPHKHHKQLFHGFHQSKHAHPQQKAKEWNPSLSSVFPWLGFRKTTKKWHLSQENSVFEFMGSFLLTLTVHWYFHRHNRWTLSPTPESTGTEVSLYKCSGTKLESKEIMPLAVWIYKY